MTDLADHRRTCELPDGRTLAYLDLGNPSGHVVVWNHGGLSSSHDVLPADAAAADAGIRIVSPDRPGLGGSTRRPGRTLLDWPADVAALLDHLGVDGASVAGWSVGGLYAAACAHLLADRVRAAALIACPIPSDWDDEGEHLNRLDRTLLALSGKAAPVDRAIFHLLHATASHAPKAFAKQSGVAGELAVTLPEAVAAGLIDTRAVVDDYRVFGAPWGFSPEDLRVPVHLWQGDADELVPAAWGPRLASVIPSATLTMVPEGTHFLAYDRWPEILEALRPS